MKKLVWVGDALDDLKRFPDDASRPMGFAPYLIQEGETPSAAKPLKGLSGVYEIVQQYDTDTYRAVYIAKLRNAVYVLYCFQKKSKRGKETSKKEIDLR